MLAEKFILVLETLRSYANSDGNPRVVSHLSARPGQIALAAIAARAALCSYRRQVNHVTTAQVALR